MPEIDVVIAGRQPGLRATHKATGNTIIVRAGKKGENMGYLDLVVDPDGEIIEYGGRSVPLGNRVRDNKEIAILVNEMNAELQRLKEEVKEARRREYQSQFVTDRYIGAEACARCHEPEYESWKASGHANAYESLVSLGMQSSGDCLKCHVVGHNTPTGFYSSETEPDLAAVQCESCHRMGTDHVSDGEGEEVVSIDCMSCHDAENSPDFELESYLEKIKHWD